MYEYRSGSDITDFVQFTAGIINGPIESIGQFKDGVLEAGAIYYHYNGHSVHASITIGRPITKTFLREIFRYPLEVLGVHTIVATANSFNVPSIKFLKKLGFKCEATLKGIAMFGGDFLYFTIDKATASKWLKKETV